MPRVCTVCAHPRTAEIAKALASGGSNRDVALRYEVTASAVQRHRVNCLRSVRRPQTPRGKREETSPSDSLRFDSRDPSSLVATTVRLVDEALGLLEHAKRKADTRTALAALREARDGLQLLMRTAGMLSDAAQVTVAIDARRQQMAVLAKLSEDDLRAIARGADSASLSREGDGS